METARRWPIQRGFPIRHVGQTAPNAHLHLPHPTSRRTCAESPASSSNRFARRCSGKLQRPVRLVRCGHSGHLVLNVLADYLCVFLHRPGPARTLFRRRCLMLRPSEGLAQSAFQRRGRQANPCPDQFHPLVHHCELPPGNVALRIEPSSICRSLRTIGVPTSSSASFRTKEYRFREFVRHRPLAEVLRPVPTLSASYHSTIIPDRYPYGSRLRASNEYRGYRLTCVPAFNRNVQCRPSARPVSKGAKKRLVRYLHRKIDRSRRRYRHRCGGRVSIKSRPRRSSKTPATINTGNR